MDKDEFKLIQIWFIFLCVVLLSTILDTINPIMLQREVLKNYDPINNNNVGLYRELNDNGLSEEIYVLNNNTFTEVELNG